MSSEVVAVWRDDVLVALSITAAYLNVMGSDYTPYQVAALGRLKDAVDREYNDGGC